MAERGADGFMGAVAGMLLAALFVVGVFIFASDMNNSSELRAQVPEVSAPG